MQNKITIEQIQEKLIPILQKADLAYQSQSTEEECKKWDGIYSPLYKLFLDISVAVATDSRPIRDMHFLSFAKRLWDEIESNPYIELYHINDDDRQQLYRLIARRAYDFACYVVDNVSKSDAAEREAELTSTRAIVRELPDLEKWPKEDNNA